MANSNNRIVFITGGARSGKSSYALDLANTAQKKAFIATAQPIDSEMRTRIEKHREERGDSFHTIEEPWDIAGAIHSLDEKTEVVVIDCITVWLGNLMHRYGAETETSPEISSLIESLKRPQLDIIVVSNELGMGIVPENEMARRFRDLAGHINMEIARIADKVVFMVSGIPTVVKEK